MAHFHVLDSKQRLETLLFTLNWVSVEIEELAHQLPDSGDELDLAIQGLDQSYFQLDVALQELVNVKSS